MTKRIQVLTIHGGMTFKNERAYRQWLKKRELKLEKKVSWTGTYLEKKLGGHYQIISPRMPLSDNAKYADWKVWFERHLPHLTHNFVLIGGSLGGIFLAKYLSENTLRKRALSVLLVCPPFDDTLPGEDLAGGFALKSDLSRIEKNTKHLHLLFSKDDPVVPVSHAEKYRAKLPKADITIYKSKNGHFQISSFPEAIRMIKKDAADKSA